MPESVKNGLPQTKEALFGALKALEPAAIRHLSGRLAQLLPSLPGIYFLQKEDIEELRNDAVLVTLKKGSDGSFQFQDFDPVSYAMAVARKLLANRLRKRHLETVPLDGHDGAQGFDPEQYLLQKETEKATGELLKTLGGNCEQVIRLKYYDNLRDLEVIAQKLTTYTTVDSLKNKRSQCLKKLAALATEQGFSVATFLK